jgi:transposase
MTTASVRDMIEALIGGERDPRVLAELARGRMHAKNAALVQALNGSFDDHHAELAQLLLDQIDVLTAKIERLTTRIEELIAAIPAAQAPATGGPGDGGGDDGEQDPATVALPALDRLDEVPGISRRGAQVILAEIGLDMGRFPTAGHLVSWAKVCPATHQSGAKTKNGKTGKGDPYLKGVLGEIAAAAARTQAFLGERYRRLVKRMGKLKALVAVADPS